MTPTKTLEESSISDKRFIIRVWETVYAERRGAATVFLFTAMALFWMHWQRTEWAGCFAQAISTRGVSLVCVRDFLPAPTHTCASSVRVAFQLPYVRLVEARTPLRGCSGGVFAWGTGCVRREQRNRSFLFTVMTLFWMYGQRTEWAGCFVQSISACGVSLVCVRDSCTTMYISESHCLPAAVCAV